MTSLPRPGSLILDPEDIFLLADLLRWVVEQIAYRRKPPVRALELLRAVEDAAQLARTFAGNRGSTAADREAEQATAPQSPQSGFAGNLGVGIPSAATALWLSVSEAAKESAVSKQTIRHLCGTGVLLAQRRGPAWIIDPDSLTSYIARKASR